MTTIERSAGVPTGIGGLCGNGYSGATAELDTTVTEAAQALSDAYGGHPVVIRFNSDRHSGGAWLKTDDPDGVWLNAEVGVCASLVTAERNARSAARYPDMADGLREPGIYIYAHIGRRVGEYAHTPHPNIGAAIAHVQAHADLGRLA